MGGLGKKAVCGIAEQHLQAKGHAAGAAAHAAGQIGEEGMLCIHGDALRVQLLFQPQRSHGIAQKEGLGVFVIHKMAVGVARRQFAPLGHGDAVIGGVFHHLDAPAAEQVFFPLPRVSGHMHSDLKPQLCAHDADGKPQISGGTHRNGVLREQLAEVLLCQNGVVVGQVQHSAVQGNVLGGFQHLVNAATGFDGTGNRQVTVQLDPYLSGDGGAAALFQHLLHPGDGSDRGFNDAAGRSSFWKDGGKVGGKTLQPRGGVLDVGKGQRAGSRSLCKGQLVRVYPCSLLQGAEVGDHGICLDPIGSGTPGDALVR